MIDMTHDFAKSFANEWVASWNAHDIDRILNHYAQDFIIESPLAAIRLPETKGKVIGKQAVRAYWTIGLERNPNLEFKILDILVGINGLTIYYENVATNKRAVEMMLFDADGKVCKAAVHYSE